jgi:hypothetical protein
MTVCRPPAPNIGLQEPKHRPPGTQTSASRNKRALHARHPPRHSCHLCLRRVSQAGGLMSYGTDLAEVWRQLGDYDRVTLWFAAICRLMDIAAPDVCDGTSAVGESRHRIPGASVGQPTEPCLAACALLNVMPAAPGRKADHGLSGVVADTSRMVRPGMSDQGPGTLLAVPPPMRRDQRHRQRHL